ncbi:MAG TPA: DUF4159 domain-containing protein [Planctomycetota bacterium]|nr:DUF4159 domain-containing protein [Planctomycetota bacterium]
MMNAELKAPKFGFASMRARCCYLSLLVILFPLLAASDAAPIAADNDGRGAGSCRCGRNQIEIAIVIDLSGSMGLTLNTCKSVMGKIIDVLDQASSANTRVSVVAFRTYDDPDFKIKTLPLTSDRRALHEFLNSLSAEGGGDECGTEAMQEAVHRLQWTKGSRKVAVYISDEKVIPEKVKSFTAALLDGREKGIAIHFVTPSKSAWNFYLSDEPQRARELLANDKNIADNFKVPMWDASAALTGGISVGFADVNDLTRWLLAFSLGLDEEEGKKLDVKQIDNPAFKPGGNSAATDTKPHAPALLGQLQNAAEWNTDHAYGALWRQVQARIDMDADSAVEKITPDSPNLNKLPLVYWSVHTAAPFTPAQQEKLVKYMQGGGLVWADACCSSRAFEKSLLAWTADTEKLSSHWHWQPIALDHAVFHAAYDIDTVHARGFATGLLKDRTAWPHPEDDSNTTFVERKPEAWGLFYDGRLCLFYTAYDLGAAWKPVAFQSPCGLKLEDALKLSTNLIVYAIHRTKDE